MSPTGSTSFPNPASSRPQLDAGRDAPPGRPLMTPNGRLGEPSLPQQPQHHTGRDAPPGRPLEAQNGRLGEPSLPQQPQHHAGRDAPPGRPLMTQTGRLGEPSIPPQHLPPQPLPQRQWLGHSAPPWVDHGVFFITINCVERGGSALTAEKVIECMRDATLHYHGTRWWIHLWLVMPDHIHALLSFPQRESMIKVVGDWKRYVARKTGVEWQKGFFDHRLRHDESFVEKAHYIRMNPVRKGLVERPADWPHVLSFDSRAGTPNTR